MPGPIIEELDFQEKFEDKIVVEDVKEDEHDDDVEDSDDEDDDIKDLIHNPADRQSKSEKKSRKVMMKLGLKPISGVSRVTIKRNKNMFFSISKPEVFKNPTSDTYVIFGEAKMDDTSSQLQTQAAQQFRMPDMSSVLANQGTATIDACEPEEEEEVDETGIEARDIDLVMTQASVSRTKAVVALRNHDGDIVSAIMELTT